MLFVTIMLFEGKKRYKSRGNYVNPSLKKSYNEWGSPHVNDSKRRQMTVYSNMTWTLEGDYDIV